MAILTKADLPYVLRVPSAPIKSYVMSKLGHPTVAIELTEDQLEIAIRNVGNFIAGYFPREQRLATFSTTPLQSTYPMPSDAYWIQSVDWDPFTTNVNDIFGTSAYLYCFPGGTRLLTTRGARTCEEVAADPKARLVTPFGNRKPRMRWNAVEQPIQMMQTEHDYLACTPNHPVNLEHKFQMAILGFTGMRLLGSNDKQVEIVDRDRLTTPGTWSVETRSGCFYASALGKQFYLVH